MSRTRGLWRWTSAIVGLVVVVAAIVLVSGHGFGTTTAAAPLWTDHPISAAPAGNGRSPWVELARRLKPAVVNVNTKRTERGIQVPGDDPEGAKASSPPFPEGETARRGRQPRGSRMVNVLPAPGAL